jgi:hypothetical protein
MGTSTATRGRGCSKGCFSAFHETARETITSAGDAPALAVVEVRSDAHHAWCEGGRG